MVNKLNRDFIFILFIAILLAYLFISTQISEQHKFEYVIEVEVNEGDTLWSIASHYSDGISIQAYISLLKNANQLHEDLIYPGQKLLIPQLDNNEVALNEGDYLLSSKY